MFGGCWLGTEFRALNRPPPRTPKMSGHLIGPATDLGLNPSVATTVRWRKRREQLAVPNTVPRSPSQRRGI